MPAGRVKWIIVREQALDDGISRDSWIMDPVTGDHWESLLCTREPDVSAFWPAASETPIIMHRLRAHES